MAYSFWLSNGQQIVCEDFTENERYKMFALERPFLLVPSRTGQFEVRKLPDPIFINPSFVILFGEVDEKLFNELRAMDAGITIAKPTPNLNVIKGGKDNG